MREFSVGPRTWRRSSATTRSTRATVDRQVGDAQANRERLVDYFAWGRMAAANAFLQTTDGKLATYKEDKTTGNDGPFARPVFEVLD
eukprot:13087743-Alexandrium_andersonii.AAC.1